MSVRAKFTCQKIVIHQSGKEELREVHLNPVYDANPESENGKFFKWTPSGEIRLGVLNKAAWEKFEIGKSYYVEFTPAEN